MDWIDQNGPYRPNWTELTEVDLMDRNGLDGLNWTKMD